MDDCYLKPRYRFALLGVFRLSRGLIELRIGFEVRRQLCPAFKAKFRLAQMSFA